MTEFTPLRYFTPLGGPADRRRDRGSAGTFIAAFLPTLDKMVTEGMVTLEKVRMFFMYRHDNAAATSIDHEIQLESSDFLPPAAPQSLHAGSTDRARQIIETAKQAAAAARRVYIDSVDVLLAMLRESTGIAGRVLADLHVDVKTVARCLRDEVSRDEQSAAFLSALETKSLAATKWLGHNYAGTEHLLLALCQIRPSAATDVLMRLGAQPRDICKEVLEVLGHHDDWQRWLADHPEM